MDQQVASRLRTDLLPTLSPTSAGSGRHRANSLAAT